ncbi:MAG TPA: phasin family protein [Beijerinckiaceae bacterium]|nr:phasin family protein [Beijerinckiaceae bacterium]
MLKNPFEVPNEMRDLASRSVEQARKAFETFIGAAQKASDQVHAGPIPVPKNFADASRMTVEFAERNMNAAFDMAQKLVQAKTIEEALRIQTEYMQSQAHALQSQMQEAGNRVKLQMEDAASHMASTVETVKATVAKATNAATSAATAAVTPKAPKKPAK